MDGSVAKRKRTEMQQCSMFSDRSSCSVSFVFFNVLNHFSHLRSLYVKKQVVQQPHVKNGSSVVFTHRCTNVSGSFVTCTIRVQINCSTIIE